MTVVELVAKVVEVANMVVQELVEVADLAELELVELELLVFFWLLPYAHVHP